MPDTTGENERQATESTSSTGHVPPIGSGAVPLTIYFHWCKACGICISFCPNQVFTSDRDGKPVISYPDKCTQCAICWLHCPDMAIVSNEK
jgi:2-oxoglutarate ferredoxin oxidoreductase subunit delta